ncbi:hypothetical protein BQ8794_90095 [Mesorhizobium prunaredense]|uniref:Uncharacterized protein n=1 Tax=Mesorhizobium prunaredense TaxID=1631249 RepID=A0A1R3VJ39_9HYPH|nr:hypothetical protein BQ8794_90095 [Mesorhizobium prunaredense]
MTPRKAPRVLNRTAPHRHDPLCMSSISPPNAVVILGVPCQDSSFAAAVSKQMRHSMGVFRIARFVQSGRPRQQPLNGSPHC